MGARQPRLTTKTNVPHQTKVRLATRTRNGSSQQKLRSTTYPTTIRSTTVGTTNTQQKPAATSSTTTHIKRWKSRFFISTNLEKPTSIKDDVQITVINISGVELSHSQGQLYTLQIPQIQRFDRHHRVHENRFHCRCRTSDPENQTQVLPL